jgi:hypothetical protein
MKFLVLILLSVVILTLQIGTSCSNRASGNVLGFEDDANTLDELKDCQSKDMCALQCSCGKVAYFDISGTKYTTAYEAVCNAPKVARAQTQITEMINVEVFRIDKLLKSLKKKLKKRLFHHTSKKKRNGMKRQQSDGKADLSGGVALRPIMLGFAKRLKHLCESGALGAHTPAQQQSEMWTEYVAGKGVPNRDFIRKLAQNILTSTVNIFAARCNCAAIAPDLQGRGVDECNKLCGGQYGVEHVLIPETTKIVPGITKKGDKSVEQVAKQVAKVAATKAKVTHRKIVQTTGKKTGKKNICIRSGRTKVCVYETNDAIHIDMK